MTTVHASLVYNKRKLTKLQSLSTDKYKLYQFLLKDLRALNIPLPASVNVSLRGLEILFSYPSADHNIAEDIERVMGRWFDEEAFRVMQFEIGIENVMLCEIRDPPADPPVRLQCGIRTPQSKRREHVAIEATRTGRLPTIKKPLYFRSTSNPNAERAPKLSALEAEHTYMHKLARNRQNAVLCYKEEQYRFGETME